MSRSFKASLFITGWIARGRWFLWAHPPSLRRLASRDIIEQFNLFWLLFSSGLVLLEPSLLKHHYGKGLAEVEATIVPEAAPLRAETSSAGAIEAPRARCVGSPD